MNRITAKLKRSALYGPFKPGSEHLLWPWNIDSNSWGEVWVRLPDGLVSWRALSETEKRMFLLFVAEDLS